FGIGVFTGFRVGFGRQVFAVHGRMQRDRFQRVDDRVGHGEFQLQNRALLRGGARRPQQDGELAGGPSPSGAFDSVKSAYELRGHSRIGGMHDGGKRRSLLFGGLHFDLLFGPAASQGQTRRQRGQHDSVSHQSPLFSSSTRQL